MEKISSRKNEYVKSVRRLCTDSGYRQERGSYICDGIKLLKEAVCFNMRVKSVMWKEEAQSIPGLVCDEQYVVPSELYDYASPMKQSPGPLFEVEIPAEKKNGCIKEAVVLENLQDPGNVGTVIRTANALGVDAVILVGDCADIYNPKTARATMGAIFRQRVIKAGLDELAGILEENKLPLYGAALSPRAVDVREISLKSAAVAVGSEGRGLSSDILKLCDREIIIPMSPDSESFNAAVAAALLMWEMKK